MKRNVISILVLVIAFISIGLLNSCKEDDEVVKSTDEQLYEMASESTGFTWYKNSDALLDKSAGSGHSQPFLRTRYNEVASSQLDATGKIVTGAAFPEGSLIVKELRNSTSLEQYAILYKDSNNANADANGWVWGYVNADGSVVEPSANKGSACIRCHSQTGNVDNMLMDKYFP